MEITARVLSVNTGAIRLFEWQGAAVSSGIWKEPVEGRVALRGVNFEGDDQGDRTVHGGPDKAVYAYAREDYDFWRDTHGLKVLPGLFGENMTVEGLDLSQTLPGEQWSVGTTVLEVAQPRLPCFKIGMRVGDVGFPRLFMKTGRMGAYLRVLQEGDIGAGDAVHVLQRPQHGVTLRDMKDALTDPRKAESLRRIERLPQFWQHVALER